MDWRKTAMHDVEGVVRLQAACFPPPFPRELLWTGQNITSHLGLFPDGQFVCVTHGRVVGSCTNMLVPVGVWEAHLAWEAVTGGLGLKNHDPHGSVLYGVDISVHPDFRMKGVARGLYQLRFDLVRELSLGLYGTVSRMPGFRSSGSTNPDQYAGSVVAGERTDPTLTPLDRMGLTLKGAIMDYMDDPESGNAGAVWEWRP